ncbi:tetratricopeptide repeat protein [uncultured Hyphomonas sp.]|uniref:tetratricopeptide repeat protein n=1 Tax=uncultured Hyphomonas sp. TaxID=225298 RepID=UPI002AAAFCC2|nr:tetratricopeptide repeat protein [uncultured Hyphomonas sp.]
MFPSRSITAGLLALGFAADPAFAAPDIYYNGPAPAEACADGVAMPGAASPELKRVCENALEDASLTLADRTATLANSGIVSLRLGDFEPALARLKEASDLGPKRGDVSVSLAATLIRLGRADEAVEALSDIDAVSPANRHIAYYNRALAYWALDETEEAYRDFYTSAALKPGFAPAEDALGQFTVASVE